MCIAGRHAAWAIAASPSTLACNLCTCFRPRPRPRIAHRGLSDGSSPRNRKHVLVTHCMTLCFNSATLTIRLQQNPDFNRGFARSDIRKLTSMSKNFDRNRCIAAVLLLPWDLCVILVSSMPGRQGRVAHGCSCNGANHSYLGPG